jgi:heptosyltransferase-1
MKVLLIKTSSMGDLIHLLPALTDAGKALPHIRFDWVVEKGFAEIPSWHPLVNRVIPVTLRYWLRHPWMVGGSNEWRDFYRQLRAEHYDYVIDAQGLVKSALLTRLTRGLRCGLDWQSAREPLASFAYQKRYKVVFEQHAVRRMRQLLSSVLGYPTPTETPDYGLKVKGMNEEVAALGLPPHYLLFIHGTSGKKKLWPEADWIALANIANAAGYPVYLPWGNEEEQQRATRIAAQAQQTYVLPKLSLGQIAAVLTQAKGAVAVDTGLGHLAAALSIPTVSLYNATDPYQIGTVGKNQKHLVNAQFTNKKGDSFEMRSDFLGEDTPVCSDFKPIYCDTIIPQQVWEMLTISWSEKE